MIFAIVVFRLVDNRHLTVGKIACMTYV